MEHSMQTVQATERGLFGDLVCYLFFFLGLGLVNVFTMCFFGGAVRFVGLGGTARIRHFGPDPIRSSRCAFKSASFTK